jgi:hypothetical protein
MECFRRSAGSSVTGNRGGVPQVVVKIYHGYATDRRGKLWRTPQEEADKNYPPTQTKPVR